MRQHAVTFEKLAEEEALLRAEGKRKRAARTAPKRDVKIRPPVHREQVLDRLMAFVHKTDECWNWSGCLDSCGYGKMRFGRESLAHRMSWVLHGNVIPERHYVCHKCDNPRCVKPDHLFVGLQQDNVDDMFAKGRNNGPTGTRVNTAVLSPQDVLYIRDVVSRNMVKERVRRGTISMLAEKFGVHKSTIHVARIGKTWKKDCPVGNIVA